VPATEGSVQLLDGDVTDAPWVHELAASWSRVVVALSAFAPQTIRRLREIEHDAVLRLLAHL